MERITTKSTKNQKITDSYLELSDGSRYYGDSFGANTPVAGEVVFNTGMVGYPQTFTDPSYYGQILVCTYPLIGNYGISEREDFESGSIKITGLIVSEYSEKHSHWSARKSLSEWLKENNIPALTGIDTRALTKHLREKGVMLGRIVFGSKILELSDPNKRNLVAEVTTGSIKVYKGKNELNTKEKTDDASPRIVLVDCGVKENIIKCLLKRGATVIRVPYNYDYLSDKQIDYDGIFISNGPGDPKMCKETIAILARAINQNEQKDEKENNRGFKPIFGICLGNQLLALASGANTYKLKYGHRSQNQPCIMYDENGKETKKCFITSQNHGFAVDTKTLSKEWHAYFANANDMTNEGIRHKTKPIFSCQFHPEANPGPKDTEFLFDMFLDEVKKWKRQTIQKN